MNTSAARHQGAPLDDVMLAMDVVDTLRARREIVEKELDEPARARDLIERLRKIYAAQGIEVPDEILAQGVAALADERFVYRPAAPSTATTLARIYVRRGRWGPLLGAALAIIVLALAAYRVQVVGPRQALPGELATARTTALKLAAEPAAVQRAETLYAGATAALSQRDYTGARAGLSDLEGLSAALQQSYTVRIVNRPGQPSGVWRVPDVNPSARNYYLIVEAVGADGRAVTASVRNEETGGSEAVRTWGLRVDEATFQAVASDKLDDGIIQNDVVGEKRVGALTATYRIPTTGSTITRW